MRRVLIALLVPAALATLRDARADDLQRLQGDWLLTSRTYDGEEVERESVEAHAEVMTIKDHTASYLVHDPCQGQRRGSFHFDLDPSRTPREMDLRLETGEEKGKTRLAIYRLDGDTLTIVFAFTGHPRPTEFQARDGSRWLLSVYQREPPTP